MFKKSLLVLGVLFLFVSAGFSEVVDAESDQPESQFGNKNAITIGGGAIVYGSYVIPTVLLSYECYFIPQFSMFASGMLWMSSDVNPAYEVGLMVHPFGNSGFDPFVGISLFSMSVTYSGYYGTSTSTVIDFPLYIGANVWFTKGFGLKAQAKFFLFSDMMPELNGGLFFAF